MALLAFADLPLVERIGRAWIWVAVAAWLAVFAALCHALVRAAGNRLGRTPVSRGTGVDTSL